MEIPQFDAERWFAKVSGGNQEVFADRLHGVRDFALVWNVFESRVFDCFVKLNKVNEIVGDAFDQGRFTGIDTDPFIQFFRERFAAATTFQGLRWNLIPDYVNGNLIDSHLENLRKALFEEGTSERNKIIALVFVAIRIRNNLFHGVKDVFNLHEQAELFNVVNVFLGDFIYAYEHGG